MFSVSGSKKFGRLFRSTYIDLTLQKCVNIFHNENNSFGRHISCCSMFNVYFVCVRRVCLKNQPMGLVDPLGSGAG